jgi:hypothetical protein
MGDQDQKKRGGGQITILKIEILKIHQMEVRYALYGSQIDRN